MKYGILTLLAFSFLAAAPVPAAAREEHEVLERRFWAILKEEWNVSRREHDSLELFATDVTCDGEPDFIAGRVNKDNPYGAAYEIMIYDGEYHESVELYYTGAFEQHGICGDPENPAEPEMIIEPMLEPEEVQEFLGRPACGIPIAVDDRLCDPPRVFWNPQAKDNQYRIIVFRR